MRVIIFLALMIMACDPSYLDANLIERDGVTLYSQPPLGVAYVPSLESIVEAGIRWWNDELGVELFYLGTPVPDIVVDFGVTSAGVANLHYSKYDGFISGCSIELAYDLPDEILVEVIKHELGHCLGLADDPHSLDLDSIMSSPLIYGAGVTPRDAVAVLDML